MKLSLFLHVAYALIMSEIVVTAPLPDVTSLSKRDPTFGKGDATALYAYISEDSEFDGKKAKRDGDATALYAYISEDSELDGKKAKRDGDATALYAYIAEDSGLEGQK